MQGPLGARVKRRLRRLQARIVRVVAPPIEQLVFLHVPKSAGTALSYAIEAALLPGRVVTGFDCSTFGNFNDYTSMNRRTQGRIYLSPDAIPARTEFLSGHFAKSTVDRALPGARQVMLLREPGARILSQWAYWRALPEGKRREWGSWWDRILLARLPLSAFLSAPAAACQTDNAYLRALLWPHALIPDDGFIPASADAILMPQALAALSDVGFACILEDAGYLAGLEDYLGHRLRVRQVNVTNAMPAALSISMQSEMTEDAVRLLAARSRLDRVLWHAVAGRAMSDRQACLLESAAFERTQARYSALMPTG